jgi:hypothetical protein
VLEAGRTGLGHGLHRSLRAVLAIQHGQHVADRRLHAERDPVETRLAQLGQVGRRDRLRIGLGGQLGVRCQTELGGDLGDDETQVLGR